MQKLISGLHQFRNRVVAPQREFFKSLADGQHPEALFITCSDSRINPNLVTQTGPGELFIVRNAGAIVPPYGARLCGGEAATIEYAVTILNVKHIILCGHSHCGAMGAVAQGTDLREMPALVDWLSYADATKRILRENYQHVTGDDLVSAAVQENILVQIEHLRTHPSVAAGLARGDLFIYGWLYQIETGEVCAYDSEAGQFLPLAETITPSVQPRVARRLVI